MQVDLRERFALLERLGRWLWFGAVEDLQEVARFVTHALVNVSFGALQVIVQVVAQHADQIDRLVAVLFVEVTRQKNFERTVSKIRQVYGGLRGGFAG